MANEDATIDAGASKAAQPIVCKIGTSDLRYALATGLADFNAMPTHLVFVCVIYPVLTFIFARASAGYEVLPLVFPLLAGYTLIGPLVAIGMYELSRRREQGIDISRMHAFEVFRSPSIVAIAILALMLMVIYFGWMIAAQVIYVQFIGSEAPASIEEFARQVLTTRPGWALIVVGSGVGFVFSVVLFALSVVSFPLLLDRDVSVTTAIQTSISCVLANPVTMAKWSVIVAAALLIGSLPAFVGLAVVLPVLGHATWHVYRRAVKWDPVVEPSA